MNKNISFYILTCMLLYGALSCKKEDEWLEKKYNLGDVTPTTISDFQKLLDNDGVMNSGFTGIGLNGCDNFFLLTADWQSAAVIPRNSYVWTKDVFEGSTPTDWSAAYSMVEYSNVVLDGLVKLNPGLSVADYNVARGSALFFRSVAFYNLAQVFCKRFNQSTMNEPGIPLRLTSDINVKSARDPIEKVYIQIIQDLKQAEALLPEFPLRKTRPSSLSCDGYLSRAFLNMGYYDSCIRYSTMVLNKFDTLIDFSKISTTATNSFPNFKTGNPEVIFWASNLTSSTVRPNSRSYVDSILYKAYVNDDLRKSVFYKVVSSTENKIVFKGSYTGTINLFGGIGVNEILLNRAEAYARVNLLDDALKDINRLLMSRFKPGTYIPFNSSDQMEVLDFIIAERRKELPFTAQLRWEDLRRLNEEPRYQTILIRVINGQTYTLSPNDRRYVYPIPDEEIRIFGLTQNER